jgi:uncharacterized protein
MDSLLSGGDNHAMLYLLSPAKSLDFSPPPTDAPTATLPQFLPRAEPLITALRKKSWRQVARLMDLSQTLSELNVQRYRDWMPEHTVENAKPAVLAFDGDVYDGLQARVLDSGSLQWAQQHVGILSGLYGLLRPLDLIQAYRLEMGTALKVGRADNLYAYWRRSIAPRLDELLADSAVHAVPVVVNLASEEYFKAVDAKSLLAPVIECVFEDTNGAAVHIDAGYRVLGFFAKRARGLMARYAIDQRIDRPDGLKDFNTGGYAFAAKASTAHRFVFRRSLAGPPQ